jgi:hypothetical protein
MCYGYEASTRWRKEAYERRRLELLEEQERERERSEREAVRLSQEEELRSLEKTLTRQESGARTH